eukprot:CAMPEP_0181032162 /NCGR_PEP_ID=MMETSP1070-20121207/6600_1 /TAXON_ID=265543 /ORGANISM="Minutocellus polymorphus, Strain NH13" /LENGTH=952 /DNA_ID=CAMNT_0023109551 /DNA_START=396 /DNA_END=3254 /DNA_ORIENTATION=+
MTGGGETTFPNSNRLPAKAPVACAAAADISAPAIAAPACPFEKHLDVQSGRHFHIHKGSGDAVWDVPVVIAAAAGPQQIPLSPPSTESRRRASEDAQKHAMERTRRRQERLAIVQQSREEWEREEAKAQAKAEEIERRRQDTIWKEACERGAASPSPADGSAASSLRVAWQKFGYISTRIYSFEQDFTGRRLTKLCLEDNNLQSICDIAVYCANLIHLSLASNAIRTLEDGDISRLSKLEHLNLLHNQLQVLPEDIGKLTHLRELDIAGNCLTRLPDSICELQHLRRLNVECNGLVELPEGIGDMVACQELNANSNALSELPRSIIRLDPLQKLSINDNNLQRLPNAIGNLRNMQILHASKNNISELPSSICRLESLQSLWLDYNTHMAALPADFHLLQKLRDLKMDGNPNMVLPPIEKLADGAKSVLRWSECRYASNQSAMQLSIIMSVQDILRQVGRNRLLFEDDAHQPLASLLEENVDYKGRLYCQFLPEALWTVFLPKLERTWCSKDQQVVGIRSFAFDRTDIEKALMEFRDAGGKVAHRHAKAKFRRCSCRNNSAEKKPCGRMTAGGWMCQRPAFLLRMNIIREREMAKKKRENIEQTRVDAAIGSAERAAKRYLSSDEGKRHIQRQAEERVVAEGLAAVLAREVDGNEHENESDDGMSSDASENTTLTMASTVRRELARKATTMKIRLHPSFPKRVQAMKSVLRAEYIITEANKRRKAAEETNRKIKTILKSWVGVNTEEAFDVWREAIREAKRGKRRDIKAQLRADRLKYESDLALLEYAKRQLVLWQEEWDEFNDAKYWVNEKTGESTYQEPVVEHFLPSGWVMSEPPPHIIDHTTGEILGREDIEEIEFDSLASTSDCCESSEYYSTSLDDQSAGVVLNRVTFALPENGIDAGQANIGGKVRAGLDAETAIAAARILKRRRDVLLKKRKTQRRQSNRMLEEKA